MKKDGKTCTNQLMLITSVIGLKQGQGSWVRHLGETFVAYFPFFFGEKS